MRVENSTRRNRVIGLLLLALTASGCRAGGPRDDGLIRLGQVPQETARAWLSRSTVTYRVLLDRPHTQTVEIVIDVRDVDAPHLDFVLPTWRPGKYEVLDFAGGVNAVTARAGGNGGEKLAVIKTDKTTWRVATNGHERVTFRYRLYANELSLRTRHVDDSHAFLSGSAVFMRVKGRRHTPLRVDIHAPQGWKTSTGLDAIPNQENAFIAPSYDVLADAPLEIGTHALHTFEAGGLPHEVVIWGTPRYDADKVIKDLKKLVETHIEMWGEAPYTRYVFLIHAVPGARGGTEHLNSTIMQISPGAFEPGKPYRGFLGLASHEFFHTWNVKALRPVGLMPYDFETENYTPLLWVAEGASSYYGPLLLVRAGLRKPKDHLKDLAKSIDRFGKRPGGRVQSLEESSFDAWTKFNKPNADAPNSTVSFYRKGALVSLLLDLEIRQRSGNAASFDDCLRTLYERFALKGRGYSRDDLLNVVNELSGSDFGDFFGSYVGGTDPLPFEKTLQYAGLRLIAKPAKRDDDDEEADESEAEDDEPDDDADQKTDAANSQPADDPPPHKAYIGLRLRDSGGLARVTTVYADGPAYETGVQVDDLIVALDRRRLRASEMDKRLKPLEPGDTVKLTLLRRDVLRTFEVVLARRDDVTLKIEYVKEPSALQREIYESWSGQDWPGDKSKNDKPTSQPASKPTSQPAGAFETEPRP